MRPTEGYRFGRSRQGAVPRLGCLPTNPPPSSVRSRTWQAANRSTTSWRRSGRSAARRSTDEQKAELRKRIGDRSNLVVAAAAAIAGENTLADLAGDLEAAFDRFLVNPLKDDKLCRAKLAIVQALDRMEHQRTDVFLKAARHVQFEPVWGGSEDSAPPLRAAALVALARAEGTFSLPVLVDAMADPAKDVRIASAVALGAVGSEAAGLVLRLKVRLGDKDPDVFSECLGGLLAVDATANLPIVAEFLDPADPPACEAAAMALGRSRLAEALEPLKECLAAVPYRRPAAAAPPGHRHPPPARRDRLPDRTGRHRRGGDDGGRGPVGAADLQGRPAAARAGRGGSCRSGEAARLQAAFEREFG